MNEVQDTLAQLRALHYSPVPGILPEQAQRLYHMAKALSLEGLHGQNFVPMPLESTVWELRFFTDRGQGEDVEFGVFYPDTRYCRQEFIVHSDGRIVRSTSGTLPPGDNRPNEPELPDLPTLFGHVFETIRKRLSD